jgi:hypothetical protein
MPGGVDWDLEGDWDLLFLLLLVADCRAFVAS